ncbi:hypothetical protein NDU88_002863 [Pleurodeles waltl]|uniref:Uncharacterized protein n=1 Tax=Pleurodeles waltl TaxID=8319 RepID=A0AAV7RGX0_PLEWA|nr:hypothetical protein NDU88_002863 [Pleurodeles waltl]
MPEEGPRSPSFPDGTQEGYHGRKRGVRRTSRRTPKTARTEECRDEDVKSKAGCEPPERSLWCPGKWRKLGVNAGKWKRK